jgi:hypothetical protein
MSLHPIQPLEEVNGRLRFKRNAIVRHLLDNGGIDMNALACMEFSREDREQFAQLIGYSFAGASELSYMSQEVLEAADKAYAYGAGANEARADALQDKLTLMKQEMREPVRVLFGIDVGSQDGG